MRRRSPHPEEPASAGDPTGEGGTKRRAVPRSERRSAPPENDAGHGGAHAQAASGLILVGRIGAPQGVRGQVRVQSFTADPLAIGTYGALRDAQGARTFALTDLRALRDTMLVASLSGVSDRDGAAALTGTDLYAPRAALPPPEDDEVYLVDLIGCEACGEDGVRVGTIVAVPNFGAGDILEIAPVAGGETLLVPFTTAFVPAVDVAAKRVVVIVPAEHDDADATHSP